MPLLEGVETIRISHEHGGITKWIHFHQDEAKHTFGNDCEENWSECWSLFGRGFSRSD